MITSNKIFFRFIVVFFTLLIIPFPVSVFPGTEFISAGFKSLFDRSIPWLGLHVFDVGVSVGSSGSGDKTYDYVLLFFYLLVSLIVTLLWSFFDKNQRSYTKLNYWFLILLRYNLGWTLFAYGAVKVIQLQFPEPSFSRLLQPLGEFSPMGLAWTFMGFSEGYNIFTGLAECVGGLLLFHRRTTLFGALLSIVVLSNVVAINFFFDVPVKLFSVRLLIMAIIIASPFVENLYRLIFLNEPTEAIHEFSLNLKKKWSILMQIVKWGFITLMIFQIITPALVRNKTAGINAPKPSLYGLYEVTGFIADGDTIQPLLTDQKRWRYLSIEYDKSVQIYSMSMAVKSYTSTIDTLNKTIKLQQTCYPYLPFDMSYDELESGLLFTGNFLQDSVVCQTRRLDKEDFILTSRGFHWINERPYNR